MANRVELWDIPKNKDTCMIVGWRHWVDGGAISSGLPTYLVEQTGARQIGRINPDDFYLFQLPGLPQFLRPLIVHHEGHPDALHTPRNEFHYAEVGGKGFVFFVGDEPHLNAERYVQDMLGAARTLGVKTIVMLGGIYAEVPYDKERVFTAIYSLPSLKDKVSALTVDLSNYQGPSSISSYLCKRAGENGQPLVGLYAFCPIYQFGEADEPTETVHIENDFVAWLGAMRRINHLLGAGFDLDILEDRARHLTKVMKKRIQRLDEKHPNLGIIEAMERMSNQFEERSFSPLPDVWEDELRRLSEQYFPPEDDAEE
ncbi:MAG: PAC2 family protein [Anaerolineae bacterium]|nr:MAG: PAC2 family protein [Anaerolineae bacterium]